MKKIIHNSQTRFIKGRYIGENIRLLFEIIDIAEEENKPGLILFSDFEKAFDSIDHTYEPRHAIMCLREIIYVMRYDVVKSVVKSDVIISRRA